MPVTKSRTGFYDIGLDQANTTGFLFGDDDSAPEAKLYTQTNTGDNFPTLVRRDPNMVSFLMCNAVFSPSPHFDFHLGFSTTASASRFYPRMR